MTSRIFRIGTRRSLLALTQSGMVKAALEAAHPGVQIELVGIDTEGDEVNQNRFSELPLHQLDGKNFFVKELDEALLAKRTDISVHSYKDLSLERPHGLIVAAIPKRANPRDIALFHPRALEKLNRGEALVIGSSSPRRAENTPRFLQAILPGGNAKIRMTPMRGNVPTRLKKLHDHVDGMDGIVLAFAGLSRLCHIEEVQKLLGGLQRIVLPLDQCPAAPGQGALAIECRADDAEVIALLKSSHCTATADYVAREREVLKRFGGGCHQAFGASTVPFSDTKPLTFIRGKSDAGDPLNLTEWEAPRYSGSIVVWDGSAYRAAHTRTTPITVNLPTSDAPVFVAHYRAVTEEILPLLKGRRIWTSGFMSWQKLAERGVWVEGSAENLGFSHIRDTLYDPLLQLPPFAEWTILTHEDAVDTWAEGHAVATYKVQEPETAPEELEKATHIWWASASQWQRLKDRAKRATHHACGAGKTAEALRTSGITPDIFPSHGLWQKSVKS